MKNMKRRELAWRDPGSGERMQRRDVLRKLDGRGVENGLRQERLERLPSGCGRPNRLKAPTRTGKEVWEVTLALALD